MFSGGKKIACIDTTEVTALKFRKSLLYRVNSMDSLGELLIENWKPLTRWSFHDRTLVAVRLLTRIRTTP